MALIITSPADKNPFRVVLPGRRAALPENQQREFELYLKMPYTRRDHPLVAMVQQAFGWTDAEVDALFAEADAV